jgi:hypothetical protein
MSASKHPDDKTLGRFVLGRLDRRAMAQVESHLRCCSRCTQIGMRVPDDRLLTLLRNSAARSVIESPLGNSANQCLVTVDSRSESG